MMSLTNLHCFISQKYFLSIKKEMYIPNENFLRITSKNNCI